MVTAGKVRVECGGAGVPRESAFTERMRLQAFRDLASVDAQVVRDAPVQSNRGEVGASLSFVFKPG